MTDYSISIPYDLHWLNAIAGLPLLESLDVGSTLMTDLGLERLTSPKNLRALTAMPNSTYLDLSGRQGNDKNVWSIAMSNTGLQAVLTLKNLRELASLAYRRRWESKARSWEK